MEKREVLIFKARSGNSSPTQKNKKKIKKRKRGGWQRAMVLLWCSEVPTNEIQSRGFRKGRQNENSRSCTPPSTKTSIVECVAVLGVPLKYSEGGNPPRLLFVKNLAREVQVSLSME